MAPGLLAAALALLASEAILRCFMPDPAAYLGMRPVGITMPDERLGWRFIPGREVDVRVAGRTVHYAIDREGNRAASVEHGCDPGSPTMLFCGESIMAGWGLSWDESIPALLAERTSFQPVNLAVFGYGNGQALRRLEEALPRFSHVRAVVSLVNPLQLERNTRAWQPGFTLDAGGRLTDRDAMRGFWTHVRLGLVWHQLPIHRAARVRLAAGLLARTAAAARAVGAMPLFVIPTYGSPPKNGRNAEVVLFDEVFRKADLHYLFVDLDPRLRQKDTWNSWHPTPEGARVIAAAVADALGGRSAQRAESHFFSEDEGHVRSAEAKRIGQRVP